MHKVKLAQVKMWLGWLIDRLDMTIAVEWDVKPQTKLNHLVCSTVFYVN